jgi:hypothetical protein
MENNYLVLMISKQTLPNYKLYQEFGPNKLVMIYTKQMLHEFNLLKSLVNKEKTELIEIEIEDAFSIKATKNALENSLKLNKTDFVTVGLTGGTKLMALGTYLYFKAIEDDLDNKISFYYENDKNQLIDIDKDEPEEFCEDIDLITLFKLNNINAKSNYDEHKIEKFSYFEPIIIVLRKKGDFFKKFIEFKNKLKKNLSKDNTVYLYLKNNPIHGNFKINFTESVFQVFFMNELIIDLKNISINEIEWFFFDDGWYEFFVATKLKNSEKFKDGEFYLNAEFPTQSGNSIKNEIDIVIKKDNNLTFVEAKSGAVDPLQIDRINTRKDLYGSLFSKSILCYRYKFHKNEEVIKEKCKDLKIELKQIQF